MACIVGDETGLLSVVSLQKASLPTVQYRVGVQDRDFEVTAVIEGRNNNEFFVSHRNGTVTVLRGAEGGEAPTASFEMEGTLLPSSNPYSLHFDKEASQITTLDEEGNVQTANVLPSSTGLRLDSVSGFEIDSPLSAVAFFNVKKWGLCIAVGGREREIHIYQVTTGEKVWKARELPHCSLGLRRKVFPTCAGLLGTGELYTITGYMQFRRYDLDNEENKRPVMDWIPDFLKECEVRFFTSQAYKQSEVICADNTGSVYRIDLVSKQLMMKYRGCAGTARHITVHPTLPFVASAGLSRYLYVHDLSTGKMVSKMFLKQRLTSAFFLPALPFLDKYTHTIDATGATKTSEDFTNEVWLGLESAKEKPSKKKNSRTKQEAEEEEAPEETQPLKKRKKVIVRRVVKKTKSA